MTRHDDIDLLKDMLDYSLKARAAVEGRSRSDLDADDVLAAALERFVEIIGEAASRVSAQARTSFPSIPWREIVGMRNRLIHGYSAVDRDVIWAVVAFDLPELIRELEAILER